MKKQAIIFLSLPLLTVLGGCDILYDNYAKNISSTRSDWYQKPGSTSDTISVDLKECGEVQRHPKGTPDDIVLNDTFKTEYCMFDKGYTTQIKKPPSWGCKNNYRFSGRTLPICVARGAYDEK